MRKNSWTALGLVVLFAVAAEAACPPPTGSVANGQAIFNGDYAPPGVTVCADCHGDVSVLCDQGTTLCFPCSIPGFPGKGVSLALYGARTDILETYVNGEVPMAGMTIAQTVQMFHDVGVTSNAALNDLAAFLSDSDPRNYTVRGTLTTAGPASEPTDVELCNQYSPTPPPANLTYTASPNVIFYEITNVRAGSYYAKPVPYSADPPARMVHLATTSGISPCVPPDCEVILPGCTTDIHPVDFHTSANYYVHSSMSGGSDSNDGKAWEKAKKSVKAAMDVARAGDEIWIAAGTYFETIVVKPGVRIYGGFAGGELYREESNPALHPTIIDRGGITILSGAGSDTVIDGFTIQNGNGIQIACGGSPTIVNNTLVGNRSTFAVTVTCSGVGRGGAPRIGFNTIGNNRGGGVYVGDGAPMIFNNTINANTSAAIWVVGGTIANNALLGNGAGIYVPAGAPQIVNNTLLENQGPGIELVGSSALVASNIVAFGTSGVKAKSPGATLRNNCVYGNRDFDYSGLKPGLGDIHEDPQLVGSAKVRLRYTSPCINAGDDTAVRRGWRDINGDDRVLLDRVDIGADEAHYQAP